MRDSLRRGSESGATLVEFAIVAPIFFLMLFGIVEMGLAFHNRIIVDDAVQEAGRLGSALGNDIDTDIEILDRLADQITSLPNNGTDLIKFVEIYRVNDDGTPSAALNFYEFKYTVDPLLCDWDPCPQGSSPVNYSGWTWPPAIRDVEATDLDVIGVKAYFAHTWITGMFPMADKPCAKATKNTTCWVEDTTLRLEPLQFSVGS